MFGNFLRALPLIVINKVKEKLKTIKKIFTKFQNNEVLL